MKTLVTLLLVGSVARAAAHPGVVLEVEACDAADEIRRIVALELGDTVADPSGAQRTHAIVRCTGGAAALRVDDPASGKSLVRSLDLESALPKARARLVALAMVELISTSWTELAVDPAPRITMPRTRWDDAPSSLRIVAVGSASVFSGGTGVLGGGGIRVGGDRTLVSWLADLQVRHGSTSVSIGEVTTDVLDTSAVVGVHRAWSPVTARLGAGARAGVGRLAGASDQMSVRADRFAAAWFGALALADVEVALASNVAFDVSVEGGRVLSPIGGLVADRREVAIDGEWIGVHLGIGLLW